MAVLGSTVCQCTNSANLDLNTVSICVSSVQGEHLYVYEDCFDHCCFPWLEKTSGHCANFADLCLLGSVTLLFAKAFNGQKFPRSISLGGASWRLVALKLKKKWWENPNWLYIARNWEALLELIKWMELCFLICCFSQQRLDELQVASIDETKI